LIPIVEEIVLISIYATTPFVFEKTVSMFCLSGDISIGEDIPYQP